MNQEFKLNNEQILLLSTLLEKMPLKYTKLVKYINNNNIILSDDNFLMLLDILADITKNEQDASYILNIYEIVQQLIKQDKHDLLTII